MRRDWDLIRLLLLELEGNDVDLSPYTNQQIEYHHYLLAQSPLTEGIRFAEQNAVLSDITERGHDFLSWARDKDEWDNVLRFIQDRKLPASLEMIEHVVNMPIEYPIVANAETE